MHCGWMITRMIACFALVAVASGQYIPVIATVPVFGTTYSGSATYYGVQTPSAAGACSYQYTGLADSAAYTGIPLAISDAQYTGSSACGMCIKYQSTGTGPGATLLSADSQLGFVCDECLSCNSGDLDLQAAGDGMWGVQWYPTQCPVGTTTLRYALLQGGSSLFRRMQVANGRVPVAEVEFLDSASGAWVPLSLQFTDNYWDLSTSTNATWAAGCTKLRLTSVLGDTVEDEVCCVVDEDASSCSGTAQFPCRFDYPAEDAECKFQPTCGKLSADSSATYPCSPPLVYDEQTANQTSPSDITCCTYTPTCGRPLASSTATYSCAPPLVYDASKANATALGDGTCCQFVPSCGRPRLGSPLPFQCPGAWIYDESKAAVTGKLTPKTCCRKEQGPPTRMVWKHPVLGGLSSFQRPVQLQARSEAESLRVGKGISITITLPDPLG